MQLHPLYLQYFTGLIFFFLLHYKPGISDQKQRNSVLICHNQDRERSQAINRRVHKKFQRTQESTAEQTLGNDKAEHNYGKKKIIKKKSWDILSWGMLLM